MDTGHWLEGCDVMSVTHMSFVHACMYVCMEMEVMAFDVR